MKSQVLPPSAAVPVSFRWGSAAPQVTSRVRSPRRRFFPDPQGDTLDGIVAMGVPLTAETVVEAYRLGIFPWPHEGLPLLWFSPDERGVLDFVELHVPRSLERARARFSKRYQVSVDFAFREVLSECRGVSRAGQSGTWITDEIARVYGDLHDLGFAHSVEIWQEDRLVGGIYGLRVGSVFSGESMFFRESNCSKFALLFLIDILMQSGDQWMDTQMVTPVLASLGAKLIPKDEYFHRLAASQ
jgi:leucyl/phenylalanyl-tRNA---protein transferase